MLVVLIVVALALLALALLVWREVRKLRAYRRHHEAAAPAVLEGGGSHLSRRR